MLALAILRSAFEKHPSWVHLNVEYKARKRGHRPLLEELGRTLVLAEHFRTRRLMINPLSYAPYAACLDRGRLVESNLR